MRWPHEQGVGKMTSLTPVANLGTNLDEVLTRGASVPVRRQIENEHIGSDLVRNFLRDIKQAK